MCAELSKVLQLAFTHISHTSSVTFRLSPSDTIVTSICNCFGNSATVELYHIRAQFRFEYQF